MELYVIDSLSPEDIAMLQSLYSRSDKSVIDHMKKVEESGSGKFMETYYIGYGHESIAQTGTTTIFFENVSLLAAKAIEDSQLYNGQECSTRYLDFKNRPIYDPLNTPESKEVMKNWLDFYESSIPILINHLKENFPQGESDDNSVYEKAIKAKAFDIARGYLPTGVTTNVSLHSTLAHSYNHINSLKYHPLNEVNEIANLAWEKLYEKYPNSFKSKFNREQEEYLANCINFDSYSICPNEELDWNICSSIDNKLIENNFAYALENRPKGKLLPKSLKFYGDFRFEFNIDFGSYRDYQRHRGVLSTTPLIDGEMGFHSWYINQFPEDFQEHVVKFLQQQFNRIAKLKENNSISKENLQYYFPLGTLVRVGTVANLVNLVYLIELRSQKTVHPTLREVAKWVGGYIQEQYPKLKLYVDFSESDFTIKRGFQDIVEK